MAKAEKKADLKIENKFSKEQLISAKRYIESVDILNVVLENDKLYSFNDVDKLVSDFLKIEC